MPSQGRTSPRRKLGGRRPTGRIALLIPLVAIVAVAAVAEGWSDSETRASLVGIHRIKHVIIVMQENRSFDSYFGTYPGRGRSAGQEWAISGPACRARRRTRAFTRSTTERTVTTAAPTSTATRWPTSTAANERIHHQVISKPARPSLPGPPGLANCSIGPRRTDVMGYHTAREIPNYWKYAKSTCCKTTCSSRTWVEPAGSPLRGVRAGRPSARRSTNPISCTSDPYKPGPQPARLRPSGPQYAWTDLTYLMHAAPRQLAATTSPPARRPIVPTVTSPALPTSRLRPRTRSGIRCRSSPTSPGTVSGDNVQRRRATSTPPATARCPRCHGWYPTNARRSIPGAGLRPARSG